MTSTDLLKKPYARLVMPDEDGSFFAEIVEFPGCFAVGETASDALANLDEVALDWIASEIEQGHDIPEPMDSADHSGKLVLRMTKGLHKRAALCAEREGVSLNQFITTCLAEAVGELSRPQRGISVPQLQVIASTNLQVIGGYVFGTESDRTLVPVSVPGFSLGEQLATGSNVVVVPAMVWDRREQKRA